MKVVLLAAGRSTRMWPISDKNFLTFCGKTVIMHQIESLQRNLENPEIIIVGGAHNLEALKSLDANIQVIEQENLDEGMAGALLSAEQEIGSNPFLLVSSNDIIGDDGYALIKDFVQENTDESALVGYKVDKYFPGGYLSVEDGRIQGMVEKPGEGNEPSDLVNIVVHYHRNPSELFSSLKEVSTDRDDRYEVALDTLFKAGHIYKALEFSGFWQPIKYPWHVLKVKDYFLSKIEGKIASSASISDTAVIKGNVIIEDDVKVFDHAVIQGPAYIGKGSIVANGALVRDTHLGERCVVGYTTEIARSYLADDVWTHKNYVGDSIIDSNTSFGSGTVTGNFRLDEEEITVNINDQKISSNEVKLGLICGSGVRCGINTSFMPGIKIGKDSFIGAGITISQDIKDASFVTGQWELSIKENTKKAKSRGDQMNKLKKTE